jgi:hypothetical protein
MIIFNAIFSRPDEFLKLIKLLILHDENEMKLRFHKTKNSKNKYMSIRQLNNNNDKLFSFCSNENTFKKYEYNSENKSLSVNLDTVALYQALKNCQSLDIVELTMSNDFPNNLFISVNDKLHVFTVNEDDMNISIPSKTFDFDKKATFDSKYFHEIIQKIKRDCSSDILEIKCYSCKISFKYKSDDSEKTISYCVQNDIISINATNYNQPINIIVQFDDIETISKNFLMSNKISLFFMNDYPFIACYNISTFGKFAVAIAHNIV